jgi:hypothetical protein
VIGTRIPIKSKLYTLQTGNISGITYVNVLYICMAMRLVCGFAPPRPGFELGSGHVGFVGYKVALGHVSSQYFGFSCKIVVPPIAPISSSSMIWGWCNRPVVAAVPIDLSLTPVRIIIKSNIYAYRLYVT